ncbi:MAG: phage holin family protein [Candidatus Gastranaerophilales bacterium]|mgnify:CR=1 FL=1|nr:phage holin family protein [Candidatus Gastranaerophilales bacterium]
MFNAILKWLLLAFALILVDKIVPGIEVSGLLTALIAVAVIALVNMFIRPLIMVLTLPINVLTLGLFTIIINAALFGLAAYLVPGFSVDGFVPALLGSILFSLLSMIINSVVTSRLSPTYP